MSEPSLLIESKAETGGLLSKASGAALASGLVLVAQMFCLAKAINAVVMDAASLAEILPWVYAAAGFCLLRAVLGFLADRWAARGALMVAGHLRARVLQKIIADGPAGVKDRGAGTLATLWMEGIDRLQPYYARYLPARLQTVVLPVAILCLAFPVDWISGIVMMVTAPMIPFFMIMIGKGTERLNQRQWKRLSYMGGYLLDRLQGLRTLKLFRAAKAEARMVRRVSEDYRLETMKVLSVAFLSSLMLEFLATISIALVAVLVGFRLLAGQVEFFDGFLVLLLAPEFYLPLRRMGGFYHARMDALAVADDISGLLAGGDAQVSKNNSVTAHAPDIVFDNVSFSYDGITPVLKDVSFQIRSGARAALVGPSGAGKSTIMAMLLGFIQPQQGRVLVNGINLNDIDMPAWRETLSWVPQRPHLFNKTLRENICLSNPAASDADIEVLAKKLHVDTVAETLPKGYDDMLGEDGVRLSGGQAQRIALARAFLRKAGLYLMDEPTASLDHVTEAAIKTAVDDLTKGATVLVIAHRLQTVRDMGSIILLDAGRVVDIGTHDELLSRNDAYRKAAA